MTSIQCRIAHTRKDLDDALRVRWAVFGRELDLLAAAPAAPREVDPYDTLDTTLHFVAYAESQPIATTRLLLPNPEVACARGVRLGVDLESRFDLGALKLPGLSLAEVTRFCILSQHRSSGALEALHAAMVEESHRRGITHWIAAVNAETDHAGDAAIMLQLAAALGLVSPRVRVSPLGGDLPPTSPGFPFYGEEERAWARAGDLAALQLPRPLGAFTRRMAARFIGPARYDGRFRRFAMPLFASVEEQARAPRPVRTTPVTRNAA
ncbi:GNAT family N-acetyltransferase [Sorangium atrum]|uniref:GNAT family N-acetyltransferase n=1 Tax=Sorangium atrum TaxID=2995308 RepID=A0ABT5CGD5_9BACT|nr:GNAT family N-acetyltransferase [Sorangium aterium]MDC0685490.1 GNAT family N-acetyltransferase [Sorangium aterium]